MAVVEPEQDEEAVPPVGVAWVVDAAREAAAVRNAVLAIPIQSDMRVPPLRCEAPIRDRASVRHD